MKNKSLDSKKPSLLAFLGKYRLLVFTVVFLSLLVNGLGLLLPRINARAIDSLQNQTYNREDFLILFAGMATTILILGLLQTVISNITSEKLAAELRRQVIDKISRQSFTYVNSVSTAKLLTNLTADIDSVKSFINQGLVIAFAAVVQLIGSGILLLTINWQLALPILLTIPILAVAFGIIFSSIGKYFIKAQEIIDQLNRVINESIVGSALVRVLHAHRFESNKFSVVNNEAKGIGVKIVTGFASLFPIINIVVNASFLVVLGYGGIQVIDGTLSAGNFTAFFSYIFIFITPIILIGFLATEIQRAFTTYTRVREVIDSEEPTNTGSVQKTINGDMKLSKVSLKFGDKKILKDISILIKAKSRVAIIGPTAAGKTQLFYLITGLVKPSSGNITVDGVQLDQYKTDNLYSQIGMVFQDSMIFNTTVRENIAFSGNVSSEALSKAIEAAELKEFIESLPQKLDTVISERGSSLSGGQRQRLTLARALVLEPKILLLDDFTARVDVNTEKKILANLARLYPDTTIVSITQKISSVIEFEQIILLMEGEIIAQGTHEELLKTSLEYQLIFNSQKQID